MKCTNCNTENNESAKFCKNCGENLNTTLSVETTDSKLSDKLLFTNLCIAIFTFVCSIAIEKLVDNWYEDPTSKYIRGSLWVISNLSMILIPLSIKNNTLKIIGLILTAIMALYWIYGNIEFMMN